MITDTSLLSRMKVEMQSKLEFNVMPQELTPLPLVIIAMGSQSVRLLSQLTDSFRVTLDFGANLLPNMKGPPGSVELVN